MAMKTQGRKTYTTARGKNIDLDQLIKRNELTPAVGNARVNARGDELGPGGRIVRKREEVVKDYYKGSAPVIDEGRGSKPAPDPGSKEYEQDMKPTVIPEPVKEMSKKEIQELEEMDDEWVEDDEGNFVKKQ
jgi:hypothetical protein